MLKIKYNIDLKNLKYFGFKYEKNMYNNRNLKRYDFSGYYKKYKDDIQFYTFINEATRFFEGVIFDYDTLFDLIQAGYIEKSDDYNK